jgi:1-acyl-sn-glycerol-3-phosphate acyltransferase
MAPPLKILPVGINYSSFNKLGKNIRLFFGEFITGNDFDIKDSHGKSIQSFNTNLQEQLSNLVFEIDRKDKAKLHTFFYVPQSLLKKIALFVPSIAGWLFHAPLYYPVKKFVVKKTTDSDHFDSLVISILLLAYPLYVMTITLLTWVYIGDWYALLLPIILPATAWAYVQLKKQMD